MSLNKVADIYAGSLFDIAQENDAVDKITADVEFMIKTLDKSDDLKRALESPVIKDDSKFSIIKEIFENEVSGSFFTFLKFLIEKDRIDALYDILSQFKTVKNEHFGIVEIKLKAAKELTAEQISEISSFLGKKLNKKIEIDFSVDESLMGGFYARAGDLVYDATLDHQLERLRRKFLSADITTN